MLGHFLNGVGTLHGESQAFHHALHANALSMTMAQVGQHRQVGNRKQRKYEGIRIHESISSRKAAWRQSVR